MTTKYYRDADGKYLGGFVGETGVEPVGAIEVPSAPNAATDIWNGSAWVQSAATVAKIALGEIRALEANTDDDFKKIQRQALIAILFKEAKALALANPATASMTDAQIHAYLMSQASGSGKGYAKLYLLEQEIIPLRAQL